MSPRCLPGLLALAVFPVALCAQSPATRPATAPATLPATQPAERTAIDLPVKRVILFTSGLGFLEHQGSVDGLARAELQFKSDQINDVLKSLVVQDAHGGAITGIRYASQQPLAKTLKSFQIDVSANPSLPDLLNQVRGAQVTLTVDGTPVPGKIVGVEYRETPPLLKTGHPVRTPMLNLLTPSGIQSLPLANVQNVAFQDPKLQRELHLALDAVAQRRDQNKKPVTVLFDGTGKRFVRVGYVLETPVWKTSYRLILPDPAAKDAVARDTAQLQGWAIVENPTEADWTDIQLSMVGGRPMAFIENLYAPCFVPRPVVQPKGYLPLDPAEYEDALDLLKLRKRFDEFAGNFPDGATGGGGGLFSAPERPATAPAPRLEPRSEDFQRLTTASGGTIGGGEVSIDPPNYAQGVAALSKTQKVGDMFHYEVPNVSLPRQQSAMLPIVADPVTIQRVSIYNAAILADNPLHGVKLINKTDKYLLGGPISVFQTAPIPGAAANGTAYAGDARIPDVPPHQERCLSYAVDQDIKIDATRQDQSVDPVGMKIGKGSLIIVEKGSFTRDYIIENRSAAEKTLLIEHPRDLARETKLVSPKAEEQTDLFYRFRCKVAPGKTETFRVTEACPSERTYELTAKAHAELAGIQAHEGTPKKIKDALARLTAAWDQAAALDKEAAARLAERQDLATDQARLRENLKSADKSTPYYTELLKTLQETDARIRSLDDQIKTARATAAQIRTTAEKQAADLVVE